MTPRTTWRACLSAPPRLGGREVHVQELSRAEAATGRAVRLYFGLGDPRLDGVQSVRLRTCAIRRPASLNALLFALQLAGRLVVARQRPDFVHVHGDAYEAAVLAPVSRFVRTPVVFTVHGRPGVGRSARVAWLIARTGRIRYIAVSSGVEEALRSRLGHAASITRQSSAVRDAFFAANVSPKPKLVVSMGLVAPRRDFDTVLEGVAASATRPPVRIIGDGPDRLRLSERAAELGLAVVIESECNPSAIARHLAQGVYVHPRSRIEEGFPSSMLEALAVGCPIISPPFSALRDYVSDSEAALYSDAPALALQIDAMFTRSQTPVRRPRVPRWHDVVRVIDSIVGQSLEVR